MEELPQIFNQECVRNIWDSPSLLTSPLPLVLFVQLRCYPMHLRAQLSFSAQHPADLLPLLYPAAYSSPSWRERKERMEVKPRGEE